MLRYLTVGRLPFPVAAGEGGRQGPGGQLPGFGEPGRRKARPAVAGKSQNYRVPPRVTAQKRALSHGWQIWNERRREEGRPERTETADRRPGDGIGNEPWRASVGVWDKRGRNEKETGAFGRGLLGLWLSGVFMGLMGVGLEPCPLLLPSPFLRSAVSVRYTLTCCWRGASRCMMHQASK